MRVSVLIAELRKETFHHRYVFHRKWRRYICETCQVEVGDEADFLSCHLKTDGVEKRVRQLARPPYGVAVTEVVQVIREEWDKHSYASAIGRPGKLIFGCAACNRELRTHTDFQKHLADAIEKAIRAYAKKRKCAA